MHVDVYRLDHLQELHDVGFDELVGGRSVMVVEWGDRVERVAPGGTVERAARRPVTTTTTASSRSSPRVARGRCVVTRSPRSSTATIPGRTIRELVDVLVLAIDTATARVSAAIGDGGAVIGEVSLAGGRRHAEQLVPAIQYLCGELDVSLAHLAVIAVDIGPGLFTGLRVGVTTAKVMAQALRIPVVAIASLDLVAYPLRHSNRLVVAVLDARRREVFCASYRPVPGGVQRVSEYEVRQPAELVADLESHTDELLLAGDGVAAYRDEFASLDHAGARRRGARRTECGRARRARDRARRARGISAPERDPAALPSDE